MSDPLARLADVIESRKPAHGGDPQASYVARLLHKGPDAFLKKIGEEAVEVVVGASKQTDDRIVYEFADLVYHSMVLLSMHNLAWSDVEEELARRIK